MFVPNQPQQVMNSVVNRLNLVGFYALWTIGIAALFCALSTYVAFTPDPYVRIHNPELSAYGPDMTTMMYHTQRRGPSAELRFDLDVELSSLFNWNVKQLFVWVTAEYPSSRYTNNTVTVWDTILYAEDRNEADMYLEDVVGKYRLTDMAGSIRYVSMFFSAFLCFSDFS